MKLYRLHRAQQLPVGIEEAWEFFSNPRNLGGITPPGMGFDITSKLPRHMYPGMIITYKINALPGLPVNWVSEITQMEEGAFFIDEQRFGPYKFWSHQHFFTEASYGVEMEDMVYYALPFGPLGRLGHALFVKRRLNYIFDYRKQALDKLFSPPAHS